jgi:D-alanyl-D-alanine carboxypeptidase/D-alanyl-D-alanine-endopeptidase (penicillin-binding protein 4)
VCGEVRTRLALIAAVLVLMTVGAGYVVISRHNSSHPAATLTPGPIASTSAPRPDILGTLSDSAPVPTRAALAAALARRTTVPATGGRMVGMVIDGITGSVLWDRGGLTAEPPASTTKLLTSAVALQRLGADFRFTTATERVGRTLYLVGGGDPTLLRTSRSVAVPAYPRPASLGELARRTAAALPHGASVRLRVDTSAETGPELARGWMKDYTSEGDITPPSALELDEGRLHPAELDSERTPTPAAQAAGVFVTLLQADGVHVVGRVRTATAPAAASPVAAVSSPPLDALVQRMLTVSDNDLAEAVGRALARHDNFPPTFAGAAQAVTEGLAAFGVPAHLVTLHDTSGLSHSDRVAPRALIDALEAATSGRHPALRPIVEGLPIGGFTGTLSERYRTRSARFGAGIVRAKTGTLTGVNALAGLVVDRSGRLLMFALLASRAPTPGKTVDALDAIASTLARCGCR